LFESGKRQRTLSKTPPPDKRPGGGVFWGLRYLQTLREAAGSR